MDSAEVPCLPQPARDELVERVFERAASVLVDYPPLGHRVGTLRAAFARRVDVNTAQQLGFLFVEDGVVERQVGRDLGLMTGRIHAVGLVGDVRRRPSQASPYFDHSRVREPITAG